MSQLHIFNLQGAGARLFKGIFGTIAPSPEGEQYVVFTIDPELAKSSALFTHGQLSTGVTVRKTDLVTIEAEDQVVNAIKANVARALLNGWEAAYKQVLGRYDDLLERANHAQESENADPAYQRVMPSFSEYAVLAEREMARSGINALIQSIPKVHPYMIDVHVKGMRVTVLEGVRESDGMGSVEAAANLNPVPINGWDNADTHPYKASQASVVGEDGADALLQAYYHDANVSVPVYLSVAPTQDLRNPVPAAPASTRFSFGISQSTETPEAPETGAVEQDVNQEVVNLILTTPLLKDMIVVNSPVKVVDYESCRPYERTQPTHDLSESDFYYESDEDDEDGDYYDDEGYRQRDRG